MLGVLCKRPRNVKTRPARLEGEMGFTFERNSHEQGEEKGSKRKNGEGKRISMARARSSLDLELLEVRMMIGALCK